MPAPLEIDPQLEPTVLVGRRLQVRISHGPNKNLVPEMTHFKGDRF
ncbi:MAG: hypothetical protein MZV63_20650 [Marinilabiliales bacterium]|nr:hypothetical protein [Marinilabiliales bacterium]